MAIKLKKKASSRKVTTKITRVTPKSKKINWDKYFGKIEFPIDALTYQQKMRDEWAR